MPHRAIIFATRISTVLLALSLILAIASIWLDPWQHRLSLSDDFHVGIWARGLDTRIVFFNNADYGPYRGSLIGILDAEGNLYPPLEEKHYFGDFAGVYYRYFRWSDDTLWTLAVSLWHPIALFAILPMRYYVRRRHVVQPGKAGDS